MIERLNDWKIERLKDQNRLRLSRMLCALLALALCAGCGRVTDRFQVVDPGQLYRSGQMSAGRLENVVRERGIQTVINLRGANAGIGWYDRERGTCAQLGVSHHDLDWTMRAVPEPDSLAQLVALFERAERPILVHCQGGTHRSGVAAACYVLLEGGTPAQAHEEFGLFFNNAPIGEVITLYEVHCVDKDIPFAQWVRDVYPNEYRKASRSNDE